MSSELVVSWRCLFSDTAVISDVYIIAERSTLDESRLSSMIINVRNEKVTEELLLKRRPVQKFKQWPKMKYHT
jgi:hypothetical protein